MEDRVSEAFAAMPRAGFLPRLARRRAAFDGPIQIGRGQTNSQPRTVEEMLRRYPSDVRLQFRAEAFNVANHANFGLPVGDLNSANFGRILSAGPPRLLQFALKLMF